MLCYCYQMSDALSSRPLPCWVRSHGRSKILNKMFFWSGWEIVRGDSAPWVLLCASSLGCSLLSAYHLAYHLATACSSHDDHCDINYI